MHVSMNMFAYLLTVDSFLFLLTVLLTVFFLLVPLCLGYKPLSVSLQPQSFHPLSAPIPACVHSTRLMVCVIHFTTTHHSVCIICGNKKRKEQKKAKMEGRLGVGRQSWTVWTQIREFVCAEILLFLSFRPPSCLYMPFFFSLPDSFNVSAKDFKLFLSVLVPGSPLKSSRQVCLCESLMWGSLT